MNAAPLLTGLGAGLLLGLAYFGGLWWTVRRLPSWRRPQHALWASFVVRALLVLPAFVLLAFQGLGPLLAAAAGFLVARVALQARNARQGGA